GRGLPPPSCYPCPSLLPLPYILFPALVLFSHKIRHSTLLRSLIHLKNLRWVYISLLKLTLTSRLYQCPDFLRLERHIDCLDTKRRKCIQHSIDDSGRCANSTSFTNTFRTQRVNR